MSVMMLSQLTWYEEARRVYHSVNVGQDLHQKVNSCNDTVVVDHWEMGSLFGGYFLPASRGGGNRFGPVFFMPSPS